MNKKLPLFTAAIAATSILFLGNSNGSSSAAVDATVSGCTCHGTGSAATFQISNAVEVFEAGTSNAVTSYVPGQSYTVKVTVNKTGPQTPAGYGIQMKGTFGTNSTLASWVNPIASSKISTGAFGAVAGKKYVEHVLNNSSNIFACDFVAPASGSGTLTFLLSTNGVNRNGGSGGDAASAPTSYALSESTSSITSPNELSFKLYPNPTAELLTLDLSGRLMDNTIVHITDITGRVVASQALFPGTNNIQVAKLSQGTYLAQVIENGKTVKTSSFVKL